MEIEEIQVEKPRLFWNNNVLFHQTDEYTLANKENLLYEESASHPQLLMSKEYKKILERDRKREMKRIRKEAKILAKQPTQMCIYALPFRPSSCVLLATTPPGVVPGRIHSKIATKWDSKFASLSPEKAYSTRGKVYRWANRKLEGITPGTRLLGNVPKKIGKVVIVHPASISSQNMYMDLSDLVFRTAEGIAPVWPNIITVIDGVFIYIHAKAFRGAKRLTTVVAAFPNDIVYSDCEVLDKWNTIAASKEDGILNEAEIAEMCEEIGVPAFIRPMMELRRAFLRETNQSHLLPVKQR